MSKRGSCWVGYEQKGMKKKGGKLVPNCVPAGMKKGSIPPQLKKFVMAKKKKAKMKKKKA